MRFLAENEMKNSCLDNSDTHQYAYDLLQGVLGFTPEDRFAKDDIKILAKNILSWKKGDISYEVLLIRTYRSYIQIMERLERNFKQDHDLLNHDIDLSFAQLIKPLLEKSETSCCYIDYQTLDNEYKDQMRQVIIEKLGFEPKKHYSRHTEIRLRHSLKQYQQGQLSEENYNKHIDTFTTILKKRIYQDYPDQAHLIKTKDIEKIMWNEDETKPKFKVFDGNSGD